MWLMLNFVSLFNVGEPYFGAFVILKHQCVNVLTVELDLWKKQQMACIYKYFLLAYQFMIQLLSVV